MAETESTDELDLAKVQDFIKGQVETFAKEIFAQQPQAAATPAQRIPTQEDAARQQLADIIIPFVKPGMDAVQLETAYTRDYVDFYSDPAHAEDKDAVEAMFVDLKQKGRPLPRRDIHDYLQGKMAREKPDDFNKKRSERQRRQTEAVTSGADMGFGALDRARSDPQYDPRRMTLDDLEKALEGVTF